MATEEELKNMTSEQIAELQKQNCIFCKIISKEIPSKVVHDDELCIAILDINPANEGHTLIIPKEHYQIMPQVPGDTLGHMFNISKKISKALLMSALSKSTSIFVANGAAAGQKSPHFMIHVIPRQDKNEFFTLQGKETSASDLDQMQKSLTAKLQQILGKNTIQETKPEQQLPETQPAQAPQEFSTLPEIKEESELASPESEEEKDQRKIHKTGIKKEKGYLYYVDKEGDVARTPMKWKKDNEKKQEPKEETKEQSSETASAKKPENTDLDKISNLFLGGQK
ncbi:HIT domain-containing protein [Candidatus Woesearchaeota archaeon]|nr:HIT domain-containing protein [Candidatus Woesearchaeota archaeon]